MQLALTVFIPFHLPARHGAVIKLSQAAKIAQNKGINNWYVANAP